MKVSNLKNIATYKPKEVTCDQEAIILEIINKVITTTRVILPQYSTSYVDRYIVDGILEGLANAAAIEIIKHLGYLPCYENLKEVVKHY